MLEFETQIYHSPLATYSIIEPLGHGAFGEVLLAACQLHGSNHKQKVAIKRVYPQELQRGEEVNLQREVAALEALSHPNIISIKDVFEEEGALFLVQEYCWTDLAQVLTQSTDRLREKLVKRFLLDILQGVQACHKQGIMHRDLKPSNLLISHSGVLKLGDFGLARTLDPARTREYSHKVATRWYRAPELLFGSRSYDQGVDMWAVGMIFAEMLGLSPLIPGSTDIDQLSLMQKQLGTITEEGWPKVVELPDWHKVCFQQMKGMGLSALLPDASVPALVLLEGLLRYDPSQRMDVGSALGHLYFTTCPPPASHQEVVTYVSSVLGKAGKASGHLVPPS